MTNVMSQIVRAALVYCCALLAVPVFAQPTYEIGVLGLISSYRSVEVTSPAGSGDIGADFGGGGGFVFGQSGDRWGGEFRYLFSRNDFKVESGSSEVSIGGQTHTIHYDVLHYFSDSDSSVRPYLAGGVGVKTFQTTGSEVEFQDLSGLALLTKDTQTRLVGDFGVGVKVKVGGNGIFRVEFRDYVSEVPEDVFVPSIGADIGSVLHQWTGLVGFSWTF